MANPACFSGLGKVSGPDADKNGMTKEQATDEATEIAKNDGIRMVVTFDPYAENEDDTQNFGYFPQAAIEIFSHEEVIDTIEPG